MKLNRLAACIGFLILSTQYATANNQVNDTPKTRVASCSEETKSQHNYFVKNGTAVIDVDKFTKEHLEQVVEQLNKTDIKNLKFKTTTATGVGLVAGLLVNHPKIKSKNIYLKMDSDVINEVPISVLTSFYGTDNFFFDASGKGFSADNLNQWTEAKKLSIGDSYLRLINFDVSQGGIAKAADAGIALPLKQLKAYPPSKQYELMESEIVFYTNNNNLYKFETRKHGLSKIYRLN